jgi:hypothetical protein
MYHAVIRRTFQIKLQPLGRNLKRASKNLMGHQSVFFKPAYKMCVHLDFDIPYIQATLLDGRSQFFSRSLSLKSLKMFFPKFDLLVAFTLNVM